MNFQFFADADLERMIREYSTELERRRNKRQAAIAAPVQFSYTGGLGDITWWFSSPREPRRVSLSHWGLHEV